MAHVNQAKDEQMKNIQLCLRQKMLKTKRKLPRAVVQVGCIPVPLQASILAFTIFSHVG